MKNLTWPMFAESSRTTSSWAPMKAISGFIRSLIIKSFIIYIMENVI